ncbi:MAG: hypothetical protein M3Y88_08220 [Chloroflexota bacterium]|nr:hypothetical protein [Chloroflexota bacterium]
MTDEVGHCIKCGREIGPDETICGVCNRAGMATPSATQYHGTVVVAIIAGVVALAIAASLSLRGVGPYRAEAVAFAPGPGDVVDVTVAITNEGSKLGHAKCQLTAFDASGRELQSSNIVSTAIPGGERVTDHAQIPGVGQPAARVSVTCS